jgi:uncharacterized membrane protein (UPF0127 family)
MGNNHKTKQWRGPLPAQVTPLFAVALMLAFASLLTVSGTVPPWRLELPERERPVTVFVGGVEVLAELADEPEEQSLGLGERDGLMPGTGMLFAFPDSQPRTFWMYGMRFCLDIIWIDGGEVIGAAESVCPSPSGTATADLPRFRSPGPARYVLEVPAGFMDEHGLQTGSPVEFQPDPGTLTTKSS